MSKTIKKYLLKTLALTLSLASMLAITPNKANAAWIANGQNWYYQDGSGQNVTGWLNEGGKWYYMWSDGTMAHDTWLESANGKWYYFNSDGSMATNTTINGYTIGSDGAWIITSRGALGREDVLGGTHLETCRIDLAENLKFTSMADTLSSCNIYLDETYKYRLASLIGELEQDRLNITEAKNQCVGKVVQGKYMITDIRMYSQEFNNNDVIGYKDYIDVLKQKSDICNYKINSNFYYDKYVLLNKSANHASCGFVWQRIIIEFQEV